MPECAYQSNPVTRVCLFTLSFQSSLNAIFTECTDKNRSFRRCEKQPRAYIQRRAGGKEPSAPRSFALQKCCPAGCMERARLTRKGG